MGHGNDRHVHARHAADLERVDSPSVHHHFAFNGTATGLHPAHPTRLDLDRGHSGVGKNLCSALACPLGQSQGQLTGIDEAIGRQKGRAVDAVGAHDRKTFLRFVGVHQVERQSKRFSPIGLALQLFHALGRRREPQRPHFSPARLQVDLFAE